LTTDIKEIIHGKTYIGEGARRRVFDFGNGNVIKVAKSKYGIKSNKREVKLYKWASGRLKKYLAKIRDFDHRYRWVIMKKYDAHFPNSKKYERKLRKMRIRFKRVGISPYEVVMARTGKPNFANLRLKKSGKIVVIDYGNFKFYRKQDR